MSGSKKTTKSKTPTKRKRKGKKRKSKKRSESGRAAAEKNPYVQFCRHHRPRVKAANPGVNVSVLYWGKGAA